MPTTHKPLRVYELVDDFRFNEHIIELYYDPADEKGQSKYTNLINALSTIIHNTRKSNKFSRERFCLVTITGQMKEGGFVPVSYTHLDVYKRQVKPLLERLATFERKMILVGQETWTAGSSAGAAFPQSLREQFLCIGESLSNRSVTICSLDALLESLSEADRRALQPDQMCIRDSRYGLSHLLRSRYRRLPAVQRTGLSTRACYDRWSDAGRDRDARDGCRTARRTVRRRSPLDQEAPAIRKYRLNKSKPP